MNPELFHFLTLVFNILRLIFWQLTWKQAWRTDNSPGSRPEEHSFPFAGFVMAVMKIWAIFFFFAWIVTVGIWVKSCEESWALSFFISLNCNGPSLGFSSYWLHSTWGSARLWTEHTGMSLLVHCWPLLPTSLIGKQASKLLNSVFSFWIQNLCMK